MIILTFCTCIVGCVYYIFSNESRSHSFAAFVIGAFLGVLSCIVLTFFSFSALESTTSILAETFRIFLKYFAIPLLISLPLYFLFSFSLSEEVYLQVPSMILGLFSILFVAAVFSYRLEPESFRAEILLLLMFSVVFLSELLLKLTPLVSFMPQTVAVLLALLLLIVLSFPLCIILGTYYFYNNRILTFLLSAILLALLAVPQRVFAVFK
ncbi:MAG: hypothetical protein IJU92_06820 [Spirochaetaceae bacterium]|nr:hypothetical protein [Spirochaetaceae bacterium]